MEILFGPFVDDRGRLRLGQGIEQSEVLVLLHGGLEGGVQRLDTEGRAARQAVGVAAVAGGQCLLQRDEFFRTHFPGDGQTAGAGGGHEIFECHGASR